MSVRRLNGVGVSPGRASGPVVVVAEALPEPASDPLPAGREAGAARTRPAAEAVAKRLTKRADEASGDVRAVLETTAAMAADPALISRAEGLVLTQSLPAARAVYEAAGSFASTLRAAGG